MLEQRDSYLDFKNRKRFMANLEDTPWLQGDVGAKG
jgi:hypothetical protein